MNRYTCTDCHHPIPNGMAVIRSISLQRVTLHRDCAELRGIHAATVNAVIDAHIVRRAS